MKRREIVPVTALVPLQGHLCERVWRTGPPDAISHTKSLFDSHHVADSKEKGESKKRSKRGEKKPTSPAHDAQSERLSIRSDRRAMGGVGTPGSSAFSRGRLSRACATRNRQCHPLRVAQWVSLALAAP